MVLVCGLSAEWRVPIVEPYQRRSRSPGAADRTRARADARSPRRLPTADDRREGGRGRVSSVSLDGEMVVYGAISTFARPPPPETRLNETSLVRGRAAKLNQIINQPYLHGFFLQIWTRRHEYVDVFRKLFNRHPAAHAP